MAKSQSTAQPEQSDEGLLNLREAAAYLEVTDQRVRTILREGRIVATKNEKGYWRVSKEELDKYNATKGSRRSGAKSYVFRASEEELATLQEFAAENGLDLGIKPRYKYDAGKAKAYRQKRKAQLATEKAAEKSAG